MRKTIKRSLSKIKRFITDSADKDMVGLSKHEHTKLVSYAKNFQGKFESVFFDKPVKFTSPFWFLHSIQEIFVDEVYKLPKTDKSIKIIDCGANIGLSVLYFKMQNQHARITAIEADPLIFNLLKDNIHAYDYDGIELINAAVWKEDTTVSFSSEGSVGGKMDNQDTGNTVQVPAVRLRSFLHEKVDFLKIDIEGAEYEVLKDCRDLLKNVDNLFIEFHGLKHQEQRLHEILDWVNAAGFRYYLKEAWNNMTHPFLITYNDYYHLQLNIFCFRETDS